MPHGYQKTKDAPSGCEFCKKHRNGDKTRVLVERDGDIYRAEVRDEGQRMTIDQFASKQAAESEARNWMQRNPKGLNTGSTGNGMIPGADTGDNPFGL